MCSSRVSEHLGDISGDGWDDFLVSAGMSGDDTLHFIYFGGPSVDTIPDVILTERMEVAERAGDINHDGYDDLITGFPFPSNHGSHVEVYYGGPDMDSLPDVSIDDDDFPCCQQYFGRAVSGIGDYNGDGVDDFAFTSQGFPARPWLYIYLGWKDPTDVDTDTDPNLPVEFELRQNYPKSLQPLYHHRIQPADPKSSDTGHPQCTWPGGSDTRRDTTPGRYSPACVGRPKCRGPRGWFGCVLLRADR